MLHSYHDGLGKWVEIGNSGMFRPEMLLPMGLPEDVRVIAWGLSLERPCMIKYGIDNIRDLVGHRVDLAMVRANPLCRYCCCCRQFCHTVLQAGRRAWPAGPPPRRTPRPLGQVRLLSLYRVH